MTNLADSFPDSHERRQAWLHLQELAKKWRETRDEKYKAEAAPLLVRLMASEALVKIKAMRVDQKLPPHAPKRDYKEFAVENTTSVLSHKNTRVTAILDNHDPEIAMMSTMVNFYLERKIYDKVRKEPVQGIFRSVARKKSAGDKKKPSTLLNAEDEGGLVEGHENDDFESMPLDAVPNFSNACRNSMLCEDAPANIPNEKKSPDIFKNNFFDFEIDLKRILDYDENPRDFQVVKLRMADGTIAEVADILNISQSTVKRSEARAKEKIKMADSGKFIKIIRKG
jgi:DNA-binding CsgD family transcriptional regulator